MGLRAEWQDGDSGLWYPRPAVPRPAPVSRTQHGSCRRTERVAMAISRHRTRAVFKRYNIVSGSDLKEAGAAMERAQQAKNAGAAGSKSRDRED